MTKAQKKKWVAALRSGKYKKTMDILKDETTGGFCCLGVACEIGIASPVGRSMVKKAFLDVDTQIRFVDLNDGCGGMNPKSFKFIAYYIERYL